MRTLRKTVKQAILGIEEVEKADVSFKDKNAKIKFDQDKTTLEQIESAIEEQGYTIAG